MKYYDKYKKFKTNLILKYKNSLSRNSNQKILDSFISIDDFLAVEMSKGPEEKAGNIFYNYQSVGNTFNFFTILVNHYKFNEILCIPKIVTKWKKYIDLANIVFIFHSDELIIPKKLKKKIKKCMDADIRFIYFTFIISYKDIELTHVNMIVIDLFKNTLERFEPYGFINKHEETKVNNAIKNRLLNLLELENFKYLNPLDISPKIGPQKKADAYNGMCATYTMLYLQLRLMNPDIIQKQLVNYLVKMNKTKLINLVLRYAKFIELTLKNYEYQIFENDKYISKKWIKKQEYIISSKEKNFIKIF